MPLRDSPSTTLEGGPSAKTFFLALAETLAEHHLLGPAMLDEIKTEIRQEIVSPFSADSILTTLSKQDSLFLNVVLSRYSRTSLFSNLFRYSCQVPLQQYTETLNTFAESLLQRATLLFNRSFIVGEGPHGDREVMVPSFLLELAHHVLAHVADLDQALAELRQLLPADGDEQSQHDDWDRHLSERLGMGLGQTSALPLMTENLLKCRIGDGMQQLVIVLRAAMAQVSLNGEGAKSARFHALLDELKNNAQQLRDLNLEAGNDSEIQELRRLDVLSRLLKASQLVEAAGQEFLYVLGQCLPKNNAPRVPLQSYERRLTFDLIKNGGQLPDTARRAAIDLLSYCEEHGITAEELIEPELMRINQNLRQSSLELLRRLHRHDQLMNDQLSVEKERNFGHLQRLKETLSRLSQKALPALLLAAVLPLGLAGCGLKTVPRSDIDDLRPEIPYRKDAASAPLFEPAKVEDIKPVEPKAKNTKSPTNPKEKTP